MGGPWAKSGQQRPVLDRELSHKLKLKNVLPFKNLVT